MQPNIDEVEVDEFVKKLVNDYKVPVSIAQECSNSHSPKDQKVIESFLSYYGKYLTIPDTRYGKRPRI